VCHRVKPPLAVTSYHIYAEEITMAELVLDCSVSTPCQQARGVDKRGTSLLVLCGEAWLRSGCRRGKWARVKTHWLAFVFARWSGWVTSLPGGKSGLITIGYTWP
jgi:hypothetical protein